MTLTCLHGARRCGERRGRGGDLDTSRLEHVTRFVVAHFNGVHNIPCPDGISRVEISQVVHDMLAKYGRFPLHAGMIVGDPPVFYCAQVRKLAEDKFVVANLEDAIRIGAYKPPTREFNNGPDAVNYFVRASVPDQLHGVPVL